VFFEHTAGFLGIANLQQFLAQTGVLRQPADEA
jgi:hypothetical protein